MSTQRAQSYAALLASIKGSPLPDAQTEGLTAAVTALYASRPNAMDKVQAPIARALRNPTFPGIWETCVSDIPGSKPYAPLRAAADAIATFVATLKS
jgi:hypothetical protein